MAIMHKKYRFNGYNWYNISRSQSFFLFASKFIYSKLKYQQHYETCRHFKSIVQTLNSLEFWYTYSNPFHFKQNDKTLSLIKIRLFTFSLYMRHEIYATTFYGPLCLFGKNTFIRKLHKGRKRRLIWNEMHEFWFVLFYEGCHVYFYQFTIFSIFS